MTMPTSIYIVQNHDGQTALFPETLTSAEVASRLRPLVESVPSDLVHHLSGERTLSPNELRQALDLSELWLVSVDGEQVQNITYEFPQLFH